jgi:hypothetical protein
MAKILLLALLLPGGRDEKARRGLHARRGKTLDQLVEYSDIKAFKTR